MRTLLTLFFGLIATSLIAQHTASGLVLDDLGEPVIGASVLEVGTTNGTITNFDGIFQLVVEDGAKLEIS